MFFPKASLPYLIKAAYLSFCFIGSFPSTTAAQPAQVVKPKVHKDFNRVRESLVEIIHAVQNKYEIPGLSLAVTRGNETLWLESFGRSNTKKLLSASPKTIFRAGSLAKPLTAIAIMQLADEGKIDIDQPVTAYIPEFQIKKRHDRIITVRDILCHHSGLPTDFNKGKWTNDDFKQVVRHLAEEYTTNKPNKVYGYSNVGYTILGLIIERVQPLTYSEYMQKNIFQRLKMEDTSLASLPPITDQHAQGYKGGQPHSLLPIRDVPAFGLMTSSADLQRLMQYFLDRKSFSGSTLLQSETVEEMLEPQNTDVALDKNVINGLGWFLEHDPLNEDNVFIRHGGTTLYFSSEMILSTQDNIGVAVLANAADSRAIVSAIAEEILNRFRNTNRLEAGSPITIEKVNPQLTTASDGDIVGKYVTDFGVISIHKDKGRLSASIRDIAFHLEMQSDGWVTVSNDDALKLPTVLKSLSRLKLKPQVIDGTEVILAKQKKKEILLGQKMAAKNIPEAWKQRVGKYHVYNKDSGFPITDTELLIENGILYMKYKMPLLTNRPIQSPLNPVSDNEAVVIGLGQNRGDTLHSSKEGGKEYVYYSGYKGYKIN